MHAVSDADGKLRAAGQMQPSGGTTTVRICAGFVFFFAGRREWGVKNRFAIPALAGTGDVRISSAGW